MKRKEIAVIVGVAIFAAIISIIISGKIFGTPKKNPIKVPIITKIDPTLPDAYNDENYKPIYNQQAIDPTQLIQIGTGSNGNPFQNANH